MRNVSDKSCGKNQNTHFMLNNFFLKSWRLRHNVEEYGTAGQATDGDIIWRICISWWLTKATETHSDCAIFTAS
jgi:hypothetical protein